MFRHKSNGKILSITSRYNHYRFIESSGSSIAFSLKITTEYRPFHLGNPHRQWPICFFIIVCITAGGGRRELEAILLFYRAFILTNKIINWSFKCFVFYKTALISYSEHHEYFSYHPSIQICAIFGSYYREIESQMPLFLNTRAN